VSTVHHPHSPIRGRALGAGIGAVVCLAVALIGTHALTTSSDIVSTPAMIVTAIFAGAMAGLLFASIVIGGREDARATREAHDSLDHEHPARRA
jgi:hypothetical protein